MMDLNCKEIRLITQVGFNVSEINGILRQVLNNRLVDFLKPSKEELAYFRTSGEGISLLSEHIRNKGITHINPIVVTALWNFYNSIIKGRSKKKVEMFKKEYTDQICKHCGKDNEEMEVDHIISLEKGGEDSIDNMQYLCYPCNRKKRGNYDPYTPFIV
jgi:hypothetical protein